MRQIVIDVISKIINFCGITVIEKTDFFIGIILPLP